MFPWEQKVNIPASVLKVLLATIVKTILMTVLVQTVKNTKFVWTWSTAIGEFIIAIDKIGTVITLNILTP